jgi:hypothetical protein
MNRRVYILTAILIGLSFPLTAQSSDNFLNSMNERINGYFLDTPHDNLYLHIDRSVYFPGDEINICAYVSDAATLMPSQRSNKYKLVLVDNKGATVYGSVLEVFNGKSFGKFQIPENIEQGMYRLIGFTMNNKLVTANKVFSKIIFVADPASGIMLEYDLEKGQYKGSDKVGFTLAAFGKNEKVIKNLNIKYQAKEGEEIFAEGEVKSGKDGVALIEFSLPGSIFRNIYVNIVAEKRKAIQTINFKLPTTRVVDHIEFHPEGGDLIAGLNGKIAFQAFDAAGVPVNFSGTLYADDQKIEDVWTYGNGIGLVSLSPESGKNYEIGIDESVSRFVLPATNDNDVAIRIAELEGGKLNASIAFAGEDYPSSTGVIVALFRKGLLYWSAPGTLEQTKTMKIPVQRVPPGVSTLVLFSKDGALLSSRTFYMKEVSGPELDISLNKLVFASRQKLTADISLIGKVPGNVSEFVFSTSVVPADLLLEESLLLDDYMMLEVDFLEDGQSIIDNLDRNGDSEVLDAMMLVYTWNGYTWDHVLGVDEDQHAVPVESDSITETSGDYLLSYPEYLQAASLIDYSLGIVDKRKVGTGTEFYKKQLENGMSVLEVVKTIKPFTMSGDKILFGGVNSLYNQQGALIIIDNQQMGESASILSTINPTEVESIYISTNPSEIQRYTGLNVVGIIEINLKGSGTDSRLVKMSPRDKKIAESNESYMEGYPDYSDETDAKSIMNDHRQLLYINSEMILDDNMQYSFEFYTPDIKGEYVITIQGMVGIYPVVKRLAFEVK